MYAVAKKLNSQSHVLSALCTLLFLGSICLYIYFVSSAVNEVVLRKSMTRDITHIRSEIAALETQYMQIQHKVSNQMAQLDEFAVSEEKIFISRTNDTSLVVADNTN